MVFLAMFLGLSIFVNICLASSLSRAQKYIKELKASGSYAYLTSVTIKAQFATHVPAFTEY